MSYLAGLTLGTMIAEKICRCKRKSSFTLAHAIPGRRRYYNPRLKDPSYAEKVYFLLKDLRGIKTFSINPLTGSLLLYYNCKDENIDMLINQLDSTPKMECSKEASLVKQSLNSTLTSMNHYLLNNSSGLLDLKTACGCVFLFWGLNKVIKLRQMPAGPQMLWWSYKLLKGN